MLDLDDIAQVRLLVSKVRRCWTAWTLISPGGAGTYAAVVVMGVWMRR